MERDTTNDIQLPPGFRFHPTDEELITHYLQNKVNSNPLPASILAEVELYKFNPWDLPNKALFGEDEWYFFSPRDRKYPNGARPNRMAASGFWKATGTDRPIFGLCGEKIVGVKKALVFYKGRPPRGTKTDWIMHEYRLLDTETYARLKPKDQSMRLDDWVLCRVRQKSSNSRSFCEDKYGGHNNELFGDRLPRLVTNHIIPTPRNPNLEFLNKDSLLKDCPMLPFMFGPQLPSVSSTINFESKNSTSASDNGENWLISSPSFGNFTDNRKPEELHERGSSTRQDKKLKRNYNQGEEVVSLSTNMMDMNFFGGDQSGNQWQYMMEYQDLNHNIAFA